MKRKSNYYLSWYNSSMKYLKNKSSIYTTGNSFLGLSEECKVGLILGNQSMATEWKRKSL